MTDGFGVHTDEMRAHAEKLRGVADEVGVAQDAAGEASLGGTEAYGILCSFLPPIVNPRPRSKAAATAGKPVAAG